MNYPQASPARHRYSNKFGNIGTKCNSLTQQFVVLDCYIWTLYCFANTSGWKT